MYAEGILSGDRILLAKAITLTESTLAEDQDAASLLLEQVLPHTGNALRVGITGAPGAGKSTFIEALGGLITSRQEKVAVLTIDPSSLLTKGSILGDKTRMPGLSKNPRAFIRPSSTSSFLGGVTGSTREAALLCEAAGFENILIETVGVGQSEVMVRNMVDFFLLLMLPGAGDELQGIKKGIMEMADAVVITKADGDNIRRATAAQAEYQHALHLLQAKPSGWAPQVLTCSAHEKKGIAEVWDLIGSYRTKTRNSGFFEKERKRQDLLWFHDHFQKLLAADYQRFGGVKDLIPQLDEEVGSGRITPQQAAAELMKAYHRAIRESS